MIPQSVSNKELSKFPFSHIFQLLDRSYSLFRNEPKYELLVHSNSKDRNASRQTLLFRSFLLSPLTLSPTVILVADKNSQRKTHHADRKNYYLIQQEHLFEVDNEKRGVFG